MPQAHQWFVGGKGKPASWAQVVRAAAQADVVLFGELHDDALAHWFQAELARALQAQGRPLALGLEMWETDQQSWLDRVAAGQLGPDALADSTRTWPNYRRDYAPLCQWAWGLGVPVWATNAPRSLARRVSQRGLAALDSLPPDTLALLPPLPIVVPYDLPTYAALESFFADHSHGHSGPPGTGPHGTGPHGTGPDAQTIARRFIAAQALKDATMAWRILAVRPQGGTLLHLNGSYHSDQHEGIVWWLRQAQPQLRILTLSTIRTDAPGVLAPELRSVADFILQTHSRIPVTH
jgi:uncharacterized iron-regulated protein